MAKMQFSGHVWRRDHDAVRLLGHVTAFEIMVIQPFLIFPFFYFFGIVFVLQHILSSSNKKDGTRALFGAVPPYLFTLAFNASDTCLAADSRTTFSS